MIRKLSWAEMEARFITAEKESKHLTGYVVFTDDSFNEHYSQFERTYEVSSNCKAFHPEMNGYSLFGSCVNGTDRNLRLDHYLRDKKNPWKVDYCLMTEDGSAVNWDDLADFLNGTESRPEAGQKLNELLVEFAGSGYAYFKTSKNTAKKAFEEFRTSLSDIGVNDDNVAYGKAVLRNPDMEDIDEYIPS